MALVQRVPKSGYNDHFKYDFATDGDVADAVRMELARRQLVIFPDGQEARETAVGDKGQRVFTLKTKYTIEDGESGEQRSFHMYSQGIDGQDKGAYKAATGGGKYALLKLLLIATGDDPERDQPRNATASPPSGASGLKTKVLKKPQPPAPPHDARTGEVQRPNGNGAVFPNYGKSKGAPVAGASLQDLEYYANGARRTLADPAKARFHNAERRLLAAIEAEVHRQNGVSGNALAVPADDGEPPPIGEEYAPPF